MQENKSQTKPEKEAPINESGKAPATHPAHKEIGGQAGPEPTRYGDWEKGGRCTDF